MKIRKGDTVLVTIGKDKGRKGKVEKIFPVQSAVLVSGINMYKRHMKKRDEKHAGGIIDIAKPVVVSKLAVVCPHCGKSTRVGFLVTKNEKIRICRKCEQKL